MKKYIFDSYDDFYNEYITVRSPQCIECGEDCELVDSEVACYIKDRKLQFSSMLLLRCKNCGREYLPRYSKQMIDGAYKIVVEANEFQGVFKPLGSKQQFDYCKEQNYLYDYRDYFNIPGLCEDREHYIEGFLTPVYFEKEALVYFRVLPEYEVNIFSESYGKIGKKDLSGRYQYEWDVPFGFNTAGKLIMWLGDIAVLDDKTKNILKPFNVESDHLLIDSDFYRAQLRCVFSKPIAEKQILLNKEIFIKNIKKKYNIDIYHLAEECVMHEKKIKHPVIFSEQNISEVINAYDKVLIEGFDVEQMRKLYEKLYCEQKRDCNYKKWQSIKLLEAILQMLSCKVLSMDVRMIMSPLYILHDYRIFFDHLLSLKKMDDIKRHIVETLGVSSFDGQEEIYSEEIRRLGILFDCFAILSK